MSIKNLKIYVFEGVSDTSGLNKLIVKQYKKLTFTC